MEKIFNFSRLLKKFHVDFMVITETEEGYFDHGKYVDGEQIMEKRCGAIVPMSNRKIYTTGGTYTQSDRELFTFKPLPGKLSQLKVIYKGLIYNVEESTDHSDYCDVYSYNLKRVGVFDEKNNRNILDGWA